MPYIKSHSNYVLQKKHQDINDGTIYERDITTIGGVSDFPQGQTPIYRSNNFIVSVRSGSKQSNQYNTNKWEENDVSGTVWNLQSINGLTSETIENNDTKIVLKQDYYDFNDFAYYGSLTELFRTSVTDIVSRFPGELYVTNHNVYYTSSFTEDFETIEENIILGNSELFEVANPFGINIHATTTLENTDELKYFANEGYENYQIGFTGVDDNSNCNTYTIESNTSETSSDGGTVNFNLIQEINWGNITAYDVEYVSLDLQKKGNLAFIVRLWTDAELPYIEDDDDDECNNYNIVPSNASTPNTGGEVHFSAVENMDSIVIYGYIGDNCEIVYLSKYKGLHIRPRKEFLDKFYNECDNFEKLLMNRDTNYKAIFSVIRENELGYYRELVPFQFPIGEGGYNIDTSEYGFNTYTEQMVKIGEYYDEKFTDNLWRSMTHEAIKNFDWTYTREFNEGDEEEYVFGGQRIQKALRIFAREFDEVLSYINNIKNVNRVTYDERSNIPDYFLTDMVKNEGWDVKLVYPYTLVEKDKNGNTLIEWNNEGGYLDDCHGQLNNTNDNGETIIREFSQNSNTTIIPYSKNYTEYEYGYFDICGSNDVVPATSITDTIRYDKNALGGKGVFKNVINKYSNESKWNYQEINNEFLRRLKINSPSIWRHKGTIDGIEMILGMFGLKSDRLARNGIGDYSVTEYTSFTNRIEEAWDAVHQDYRINWVNSTKTISYDNRSISNYNKFGIERNKIPYQGIPVSYRDEYPSNTAYIGKDSLENQLNNRVTPSSSANCFTREDGTPVLRRYLYPNFEKSEQLDGNPYFQMNGGWLSKTIKTKRNIWNFQYDVDDNIVYSLYERIIDCDCNSISFEGEIPFDDGVIESDDKLYKETVRNIKRVDNINELFSIPTDELYNGIICNVTNIEEKSAVIDGVVYPIQSDWYGEGDTATTVNYISFIKKDGYISVGSDKYFDTTIIVYNNEGEETLYSIEDKSDGYEVKAYLKNDNSFICKEDSEGNYSISSFVRLDTAWNDKPYTNYFVLNDVNYATEIAKINSETDNFTSGWKRLSTSDSDYIKINTIINYNEGNNPHNGNMVYDNGHEYLVYFKKIFKYSSDNELFDSRCYDDFYETLDVEISKYGFKNLVNEDENIKKYDEYLIEDSKIHYFGNYRESTIVNANDTSKIWIYGQDTNRINGYKDVYAEKIQSYILNNDNAMIGGTPYPQGDNVDEVTNQIVNNKILSINFNLHSKWYTNQGQCELKYLDDIVMNYLTQMIPSTTILQIRYSSKD